jgi:hypothetical protein
VILPFAVTFTASLGENDVKLTRVSSKIFQILGNGEQSSRIATEQAEALDQSIGEITHLPRAGRSLVG